YGSDIAIGGVGTGIAAIVAAEHIGGEGTSLLAAASALSGFFLPRVEGEQGVVGGGHNGLDGIRRRGLAGAVAPGEQVDGAELEFPMGYVAPVYVDEFFEEHVVSSWFENSSVSGEIPLSPPLRKGEVVGGCL